MSQVSGPNHNWDGIYDHALSRDYVDGAAIVLKWNVLEPKPDVYDWSTLDPWIVKVVVLKKKLAIGVVAGAWTPDWLFRAGVPDIVFPSYDRSPPRGLCETLHQPAVWNPTYLKAYDDAMRQLAEHLHELTIAGQAPGAAYAALRIVKLSGINLTTEELRINAHPPGGPCHEANSGEIWARAGYRPNKIIDAWMHIAKMTELAFPDKVISVAVIHKFGFPPIDDNGVVDNAAVIAPVAPDPMLVRLLKTAVPVFQKKLMVQWNALSQFARKDGAAVLPQEVLDAGSQGARIGWQLNAFLGVWGGTGCVYAPFKLMPCKTIADFQAILDNGINHGGRYIEIHPVTVDGDYLRLPAGTNTHYAPAFEEAHERLIK